MPCLELTGEGFNPECIDTEDLIRWVKAPNYGAVMRFLAKKPMALQEPPRPMDSYCDNYDLADGVDWVIDEEGCIVREADPDGSS